MKKTIFTFSLVFMLCFVNVHQVYADAGSLVIGGSAIAGIGAGAIAGPAVVAVFCAMMAFGMNVELTEASEEAGMTKTEFLKNKIQEYCNEAQISANTFNNYILSQAQVFQNGAISITDQAGQTIERFCNWLFESDNVQSGTNIMDFNPSYSPTGNFTNAQGIGIRTADGSEAYAVQYNINSNMNKYANVLFRPKSKGSFQGILIDQSGSETTYTSGLYNDCYFAVFRGSPFFNDSLFDTSIITYIGVFDNITDVINLFQGLDTDAITGDQTDYDVSKGVLNPSPDKTIVINPNITIPVPQDKDVTIDVNEYLDIVQDMIDGLRDDMITAIDDATGLPITIDFDPTQDWDPTIEKEDDTDLPVDDDKTPIVEDDTIPSDFDIEPLQFDLKGFFPFCLPFDVADMIGMLQADPVAPSYTVDWDLPFIEQNLTFTVDLEPYDDVAETCRKMEILLFCVGLAVVTRSIFIRS